MLKWKVVNLENTTSGGVMEGSTGTKIGVFKKGKWNWSSSGALFRRWLVVGFFSGNCEVIVE